MMTSTWQVWCRRDIVPAGDDAPIKLYDGTDHAYARRLASRQYIGFRAWIVCAIVDPDAPGGESVPERYRGDTPESMAAIQKELK